MTFVWGCVTPVPEGNRDAFVAHARAAAAIFRDLGATRVVDGWGEELPAGTRNDFRTAVAARDGETVGFGWIEFPDRATADAAGERMREDARFAAIGDMPFDGKRMIYGGFEIVMDERGDGGGATGYIDGFILPVSPGVRDRYVALAQEAAAVFREHGAIRHVEAWGADIPRGEATDFHRAALTEGDETVAFAWIEWPDKATHDAGMAAAMGDDRLKRQMDDPPFDAGRMIYGGFTVVNDE